MARSGFNNRGGRDRLVAGSATSSSHDDGLANIAPYNFFPVEYFLTHVQ